MKKFYTSTQFLVNGVPIIGFSLAIICMVLFGGRASENQQEVFLLIFVAFIGLLTIFSSVFILVRREIPLFGLPSIKGLLAVIIGMFWLIVSVAVAVLGVTSILLMIR